ncbi:Chondramide synthase cmdD [compost metagenome]
MNKIITAENLRYTTDHSIGGKARNLAELSHLGLNVPHWIVLSRETLIAFSDESGNLKLPGDLLDAIRAHFSDSDFLAVRSSALDEDGGDFSFAGLFETKLFVRKEELETHIQEVWRSSFAERVQIYREKNGLKHQSGLGIIIQVMIPAESSGVAFGVNPVSGNRRQQLISAVYGLGEGLVSGELDADNYLADDQIEAEIARKEAYFAYDTEKNQGVKRFELPKEKRNAAVLNDTQIRKVQSLVKMLGKHFRKPQDIEFAFYQEKLYLLQSRPVTSLSKVPDKQDTYVLWDNSNIIESYPGVTTPLTFSFISKSYEGAYRLFCEYLGVDKQVIEQNKGVFENTLGLINGRVYYNLKTWYLMLAMLPGYSINARFMEKMMGVKERFDVPPSYLISKGQAWWRIVKMAFKMMSRYYSLPRKRREFGILLNETIAKYKSIDFSEKSASELLELYLDFETTLLNEWKAPLLNDFFAMIWFGRLQSTCEKKLKSSNPNIHNDLLCGSADIISTQPIYRTIALSSGISQSPQLKKLFLEYSSEEIWQELKVNQRSEGEMKDIYDEIVRYIADFGERCIGELKLETISYTQDPTLFIDILKTYVQNGITENKRSGNTEEEIRSKAEKEVNTLLRGKFYQKYKFNKTLRKARELVSSRENLRYERTRAFGIVRELFSAMGVRFYAEGIVDHERDIFYLTKEEIAQFIQGRAVTQNLKKLVALRKNEFAAYEEMEIPAERFASYGPVYHANDFFSTEKVEQMEGDLKGIGCCPGRVTARVQVVKNPKDIATLNGSILVTSSTDPGWVTLFPSAAAIIVERGSLLSHSAIVSREMGIPCIVGVTGLLRTLKTGDIVEMDGSTGVIRLIENG